MWWEKPPYTVDCPRCRVGLAQPCRTPRGKVAAAPHPERWVAADGDVIPGLELEVLV